MHYLCHELEVARDLRGGVLFGGPTIRATKSKSREASGGVYYSGAYHFLKDFAFAGRSKTQFSPGALRAPGQGGVYYSGGLLFGQRTRSRGRPQERVTAGNLKDLTRIIVLMYLAALVALNVINPLNSVINLDKLMSLILLIYLIFLDLFEIFEINQKKSEGGGVCVPPRQPGSRRRSQDKH